MKFKAREKEEFSIPRSVQQSIPIRMISQDGIFQLSNGHYSYVWKFGDINYEVASDEDQQDMFVKYCDLLNSLDTEADNKITIFNRRMPKTDFETNVLLKIKGDNLDRLREELNGVLRAEADKNSNLFRERYITTTIKRNSLAEARAFFSRVNADLNKYFSELSSNCSNISLGAEERLRIYHDFFRAGEEHNFAFDLSSAMRQGVSFKDQICPDSLVFQNDYFQMGKRFGRVLFLRDYASFIQDTIINDLSTMQANLMLSIDIQSIPTDVAVKRVEGKILAVETDIARWQKRQNAAGNFASVIPYDREKMRDEVKEYLNDLQSRDQRMMLVTVTVVHVADTKEQLDLDTDSLMAVARKHLCGLGRLYFQQEDGLNTVLPYGLRKIRAQRTLTTESTAVLLPFSVQEIFQKRGIWYGRNKVSDNLIVCNRKELLNGNGYILGISGSGKSFASKEEITSIALSTDDDIIIIDPDREYGDLVRQLGGEVIIISPDTANYINAMGKLLILEDVRDPIRTKSDFVLSLCEQAREYEPLSSADKSLIDRCVRNIYTSVLSKDENDDASEKITLVTFYEELLKQQEDAAKQIALDMEIFVTGSLNTFAHESTVNSKARIICFDIHELGSNLKPLGLLVMFDAITKRMNENRKLGKFTWAYFDEIQELYKYKNSAAFLESLWRRARKLGGLMTGLTQNVTPLLESEVGCAMLTNSEFLLMLSQKSNDRSALAELLDISPNQLSFLNKNITGVGLIRAGGSLVPFVNEFPKDTKLYKLMSTKPGEKGN